MNPYEPHHLTIADLRYLLNLVEQSLLRAPLRTTPRSQLQRLELWPYLHSLSDLDQPSLITVLNVLLNAKLYREKSAELVWTGPDIRTGTSRDTWAVVKNLFSSPRESVLLAGYSFDHGKQLFEPLHQSMKKSALDVKFFIHIESMQKDTKLIHSASHLEQAMDRFLQTNWPFGEPWPEIYYDPRTLDPHERVSLHAKCLVVDSHTSLVTSANFTDRGHHRNIEVGSLIYNPDFAEQLRSQWLNLIQHKVFQPWTILP
jgi:phosphatidylserine/phosphatidylglycerophosphate/cardiolipin synthase-like enzyme